MNLQEIFTHFSEAQRILQTIQHDHPTWTAIVFSTSLISLALLLSTINESPFRHVIEPETLRAIIGIIFFIGVFAFARSMWISARDVDAAERVDELNACINAYNQSYDGEFLGKCLQEFKEYNLIKNPNRINLGFFLNLTTEFAAQFVYLGILLILRGDVRLAAVFMVVVAIISPLTIERFNTSADFFLNLSTEFVGMAVAFLAAEKLLEDD